MIYWYLKYSLIATWRWLENRVTTTIGLKWYQSEFTKVEITNEPKLKVIL